MKARWLRVLTVVPALIDAGKWIATLIRKRKARELTSEERSRALREAEEHYERIAHEAKKEPRK